MFLLSYKYFLCRGILVYIENLNYINEQISIYAKSSFEIINFYNVLFNNLFIIHFINPLIIYLIVNQFRYIKNFLKK